MNNVIMKDVLVFNEATCSLCGQPIRTHNQKATANATCNKATANANGLIPMPFPGDDWANCLPVVNMVRNPSGGPDLVSVPFPGETLL